MAVKIAEGKSRAMQKGYEMDVVHEEDESELSPGRSTLVSPTGTPAGVVDIQGDKRRSESKYSRPKSLLAIAGVEGEDGDEKEQPPLPALTAGDSTVAGQQWPLIDEIACAIREWYGVSYSCTLSDIWIWN